MKEQWQELKETITEMRDSGGTLTQQEVCRFLINYMEILEKQMQEPVIDKIRVEIARIADEEQKHDEKWAIGLRYAVKIIDKYRSESEVNTDEDSN